VHPKPNCNEEESEQEINANDDCGGYSTEVSEAPHHQKGLYRNGQSDQGGKGRS